MTQPHGLPRTERGYIACGPFTLAVEWLDPHELHTYKADQIREAIEMFWHFWSTKQVNPNSADRMVIFDGRGTIIHGNINTNEPDWVMTEEVGAILQRIGVDPEAVMTVEFACLVRDLETEG